MQPPMLSPIPATVGALISANATRYPDRLAYIDSHRQLNHRAFFERARQLASACHQRGLRAQERLAILSMNSIEYLETCGAGELAGFITVAVNWRLAPPEISAILRDSAPRILVFEAQYSEIVARLRPDLDSIESYLCIGAAAGELPPWAEDYATALASGDPAGPPLHASPDDIAYLLYTSGTTGKPKGCIIGQREAATMALNLAAELGTMPDDSTLLMMPLFHIGAKAMQLMSLFRGATVVLQRAFVPLTIGPTVQEHGVTILHLAPTMVKTLLDQPALTDSNLASLRMLVYSGSSMPAALLRKGIDLLGDVFVQLYGQTEGIATVLHRHQHRRDGTARDAEILGSVGQPMIGVALRIVDPQGRDCPPGVPGEIVYRSDAMLRGYWNNPAATASGLRDGWCHSGDVGRMDHEHYVTLLDRKKDMLISGGENIYSREVEEALLLHPAVSEAAVIGVPDAKWGETVCAIVTLRPGMAIDEAGLIAHCRQQIASYKKPKQVVFVEAIAKLETGKVDKVLLRGRYGGQDAVAT